jgi:hypothetical protein
MQYKRRSTGFESRSQGKDVPLVSLRDLVARVLHLAAGLPHVICPHCNLRAECEYPNIAAKLGCNDQRQSGMARGSPKSGSDHGI